MNNGKYIRHKKWKQKVKCSFNLCKKNESVHVTQIPSIYVFMRKIVDLCKPQSESKHAEVIGQRSTFSNASLCKHEEKSPFNSENIAHLYDKKWELQKWLGTVISYLTSTCFHL